MSGDIIKAAVRLLIALPVTAILAYLSIKYLLAKNSYTAGGKKRMRIIERMPIGPKTFLTLVELGGCYILLAQSENTVTVVKEMDELPDFLTTEYMETKLFENANRKYKLLKTKLDEFRGPK